MKRLHSRTFTKSGAALGAGVASLLSFTGAAAIAHITTSSTPPPHAHAAAQQRVAGRGPRGHRGPRGLAGALGNTGPSGSPAELEQNITLNWEGSFTNSSGRDSQTFVAPGIGSGQVTCNQNTQWVFFQPYDPNTDVAMWTAKYEGNETIVRTARHTTYTGTSFYEGLNHYAGDPTEQGSMVGIISSDGDKLGGVNGAGPAPTTFRISWYWNFTDPNNPYCFMSGTVVSN